MFQKVFKIINYILPKYARCDRELNYKKQFLKILILKFLIYFKVRKQMTDGNPGQTYVRIIKKQFQSIIWAVSIKRKNNLFQTAMTRDNLKNRVEHKLFPKHKMNLNLNLNESATPLIIHTKMLSENFSGNQKKHCSNIFIPTLLFGENKRAEDQQTLQIKTGETLLFSFKYFLKALSFRDSCPVLFTRACMKPVVFFFNKCSRAQKFKTEGSNHWAFNIADIDVSFLNLSVKSPTKKIDVESKKNFQKIRERVEVSLKIGGPSISRMACCPPLIRTGLLASSPLRKLAFAHFLLWAFRFNPWPEKNKIMHNLYIANILYYKAFHKKILFV